MEYLRTSRLPIGIGDFASDFFAYCSVRWSPALARRTERKDSGLRLRRRVSCLRTATHGELPSAQITIHGDGDLDAV